LLGGVSVGRGGRGDMRGDVGLGSRAERVVMITAGLVFAPWGGLPWAIVALAAPLVEATWRAPLPSMK